MNALIDTCVIMDFLQHRDHFYEDAYLIMRYAATETFTACITAKSVADIYYLTRKCTHSDRETREIIRKLLSLVRLADTSAEDVFWALSSDVSDFEDAIMVGTGLRCHVDGIVTRNTKDYTKASVTVYTPSEFLQILEREGV